MCRRRRRRRRRWMCHRRRWIRHLYHCWSVARANTRADAVTLWLQTTESAPRCRHCQSIAVALPIGRRRAAGPSPSRLRYRTATAAATYSATPPPLSSPTSLLPSSPVGVLHFFNRLSCRAVCDMKDF